VVNLKQNLITGAGM